MAKILNISLNVIYAPEFEGVEQGSVYDIISREEAIETILGEVKRRIKENVPSGSDCSITLGHKIKNHSNT